MFRILLAFLLFTFFVLTPQHVSAQAVNVASFANPNLPNGALAQGGMFTVFGTNLGPVALVQAGGFPLPTELAGTSISVAVGGTTVQCVMVFTSAGQAAAILPSTTPVGSGTMQVTYNGNALPPFPVTVTAHSFGTFGINSAGSGPGVLTNATTVQVNTITTSATGGELWDIWGTGLGAAPFPDDNFPMVQDLGYNVQVFVGGREAQVIYAGRSGCCAGVDQIRFVVPSGLTGCYVPIHVVVNGVPSNFTSMSIADGGGACSDPGGITSEALSDGNLTVGIIPLQRVSSEFTISGVPGVAQSMTTVGEAASASYHRYDANLAIRQGFDGQLFTQGACFVFSFRGEAGAFDDPIEPIGLDAGPSTSISGPPVSRTLANVEQGLYVVALSNSGSPVAALAESTKDLSLRVIRAAAGEPVGQGAQFFTGGTYTYSAPGGADVGPHSQDIVIPDALNWTNKGQIDEVPRSQGLRVTWAPTSEEVMISGNSFMRLTGQDAVGAGFFCLADGSAGSFTVPASVLQSLPESTTFSFGGLSVETGSLLVGTNKRVDCQAEGLDACVIAYSDFAAKMVGYR